MSEKFPTDESVQLMTESQRFEYERRKQDRELDVMDLTQPIEDPGFHCPLMSQTNLEHTSPATEMGLLSNVRSLIEIHSALPVFDAIWQLCHDDEEGLILARMREICEITAGKQIRSRSTADIVKELEKREGVDSIQVPPLHIYLSRYWSVGKDNVVESKGGTGPAKILVVVD